MKALVGSNDPAWIAELKIGTQITHQNLVNVFGHFTYGNTNCLVMELLSETLKDALSDAGRQLPWKLRLEWCSEVATGMQFLHAQFPPIIHQDLKSNNVLLTERTAGTGPVAKIGDFGRSKALLATVIHTYAAGGTMRWSAPETQLNTVTVKCDVYSYAMLIWEVATRTVPFSGLLDQAVSELISRSHFDESVLENPAMLMGFKMMKPGASDAVIKAFAKGMLLDGHRNALAATLPDRRPDHRLVPADAPECLIALMKNCWQDLPDDRPAFVGIAATIAEWLAVDAEPKCVVCLDRPPTETFYPCGHECACAGCAGQLMSSTMRCPNCRAHIETIMKVYRQ